MGERETRWMEREDGEEAMVEEEEEGSRAVKWERFLPRMSMSVLLVESDNSTRQIITALLRKCSYRVSATSDGLKAWETLKENPHNIDLVLTEVELPSISGFTLLTMIMDHQTCKNIPVIMMSSHDSMSMVFKCMLKGAADFLVKPIRKNELRNLWQHVWRRQISSGWRGGNHEHPDEKLENKNLDDHIRENVASMHGNKEFSEKGSDAQSSCTRSEMEAESTYLQNKLEINQEKGRDISPANDTVTENGEHQIPSDNGSMMQEGEAEDTQIIMDTEATSFNGSCKSNPDKPFKEAVDLIGGIDNQVYKKRSGTAASDASEIHVHEKDAKCKSSSMPHLELSLKRYQQSSCYTTHNDESNTLNHSNSSAFSLYNTRTLVPSSTPTTSDTESKECFTTSYAPNKKSEDSHFLGLEVTTSPEAAFHYSPLSLPIPHAVVQPIYYPQAAHHAWSATPSRWQEAVHTNSSHHSTPRNINSSQCVPQDARKHEESKEMVVEQRDVSSVMGENGSNGTCSVNRSKGDVTEADIHEAKAESGNAESQFTREVINPTDIQRLNQREVALNKFRLKRKERCFEKKVRYHSRKRLAEQRPRVKGQFVRQVQSDSQTTEAG